MNDRAVKLGFAFVPSLPPERLRSVAEATEAAGLDELWVWEDSFQVGGLTAATAALARTERIRVGIGLLPVPLRNVALTAMEVATLHRMFPGRLLPGIGHGVQFWMEQAGARVASPLTLLREYATALRALLSGDTVSTAGRYIKLDNVRLDYPPTSPEPLLLGGAGPKSVDLAAELGDGNILSVAMTEDEIRTTCDRIRALRPERSHDIVLSLIASTGPGAQERVDAEAVRWFREAGAGVGVAGSAEEIAATIRRFTDMGVTGVTIQPPQDEPDVEALIHFIGTSVLPLLP